MHIPPPTTQTKTILRAELDGTNRCCCPAAGLYVCAETPILEMCRQLVKAGYWPGLRLDCYRGATHCSSNDSYSSKSRTGSLLPENGARSAFS